MWKKHSVKIWSSSFLLGLLCGIHSPGTAAMQAPDVLEPQEPLSAVVEKTNDYEYILEGRPDPFIPFLREKASSISQLDPNEIIEDEGELSGMRKFEPGQLTLVAVLKASNQKMAMVEDVSGKGYIIDEGTPIGRRGIVTEIEPQQVIIIETAHTRAGKEIKNTIVMRLKKEGEQ